MSGREFITSCCVAALVARLWRPRRQYRLQLELALARCHKDGKQHIGTRLAVEGRVVLPGKCVNCVDATGATQSC